MSVVATRLRWGSLVVGVVSLVFWLDHGPLPILASGIVLTLFALAAQAEFYRMLRSAGFAPQIPLGLFAGACCLGARFVPAVDVAGVLAGLVVLLLIVGVLSRSPGGAPSRLGATLLGILVVPFLLGFILDIRSLDQGWAWLVFLIAVAKAGDSTAFFAGRFLGSHPLIPEVSPNKTWEGAWGSVAGSLLAAWAVISWAFVEPPALQLWIPAALAVNVAAQFGDLGESLLKRGCGVKDSSSLLPMLGGSFDMVDSFLIAAPALRLFLALAE